MPAMFAPQLLLVLAVAGVGVLHTIVPDHWVPITLLARQHGWTRAQTVRAALGAGTGHALSTLAIGIAVWVAGVAFASRFGHAVDIASSFALIGFGLWIAVASIVELRRERGHGRHRHHDNDVLLAEAVGNEREHEHDPTHDHDDHDDHGHDDHRDLNRPRAAGFSRPSTPARSSAATAQLAKHRHVHRHEDGMIHTHLHEHGAEDTHDAANVAENDPPLHEHEHKASGRMALLLILGSSPMVEGIPAFFAAAKYGFGLIAVMSVVFALTTIATYVALCVYSTQRLQAVTIGPWEQYGEVLSGAFIALVGFIFLLWPVL